MPKHPNSKSFPDFGMIVDPPSGFAPIEELQEFLKQAESLDQDDPSVKSAIEQTKMHLAERQK